MKDIYSRCILFVVVVLSTSSIWGQEKVNTKEFFVEAESYFLFEEYSDALPLYQRILRAEPNNYNVMFKIGICYLNNSYQKEMAVRYLVPASKNIKPSYKLKTYKEKMAPPETNFYLGQAYRINGELDNALKYFRLFKESVDSAVFDIDVIDEEILSCKRAKKSLKTPVFLVKQNLEKVINTRFAESNAVLSGDGRTLVFNRKLQFYDAVFISYLESGENWSEPKNLTAEFGLDGSSYCTGISYNGDEIFVYRSDNFDGNIYSSRKANRKWQNLNSLGDPINTKYWESHASISPDGKTLYFTSNRRGGYGGLDIYSAKRIGNQWMNPVNLGPIVNSKFNENTPFISADGQKIFFSSLGHSTIGGYDIFVSKLSESGVWSRPINMGYPLNSTGDDEFFCPADSKAFTGIQSNYTPNTTFGLMDIYWIRVYNEVLPRPFTLKGKINLSESVLKADNKITVSLIDASSGKIIQEAKKDKQGNFEIDAAQGKYQLLVDGDGIMPISVPIELALTQENSIVELPPISVQISEAAEEKLISQTGIPKLELHGGDVLIVDSVPVIINLLLEEGTTLKIETYFKDKLSEKEEYLISKQKFQFQFRPEPGENRIIFTAIGKNGKQIQKEVTVFYQPLVKEEVVAQPEAVRTNLAEVSGIATGELRKYLLSLESLEYNSLAELYDMLIVNAEENNYSQLQVNSLFARLLTQRDMAEFIESIKGINNLNILSTNDTLVEHSKIPLSFVQQGKKIPGVISSSIDVGLIDAVPFKGNTISLTSYILTFHNASAELPSSFKAETADGIYTTIIGQVTEKHASAAVELASTTVNLEQFYNNLLLSANDELRTILKELNFDSLQIQNAIDLVEYLFGVSEEASLSKSTIIAALEKARLEQVQNLTNFKNALSNAAKGELKVRVQEIDIKKDNIEELVDIIELLLRDSKTSGYGITEVYDLMINMIGIDDVDEFIQALIANSNSNLDKVMATIKSNQFSLPIEVIQYLISQAPYFDYSDSDIHNLLIKMLLEKGLDSWKTDEEESYSKELIHKRKIVTSSVLVGLFFILLVILFWRRRKKQ